MKRTVILLITLVAVLSTVAAAAAAAPVRIGVTQIVEHPALDAARQGFIDRLAELGYVEGDNVVYDLQNAQGDMSTAQTIAQKFVADGDDLILAIATPTAQAAANVTSDIPILITAVTDPVSAGLVKSADEPQTNVTGTSDLNPVDKQLGLFAQIAPGVKRVGIIYNAGETNSVVQVKLAEEVAKNLGLKLVKASVSTSSDVLQAAQSLVGRVDGIYVPTDNTVVSALESVLVVAEDNGIPVIAGEGDSVRRGALATVGLDYYRLGRQTGDMAAKVLQGADPATMPIEYLEDVTLVVNVKAAQAEGVQVPQAVLDKADEVIE